MGSFSHVSKKTSEGIRPGRLLNVYGSKGKKAVARHYNEEGERRKERKSDPRDTLCSEPAGAVKGEKAEWK